MSNVEKGKSKTQGTGGLTGLDKLKSEKCGPESGGAETTRSRA